MSEMVERVALAIYGGAWANGWDRDPEYTREHYRDMARAAIEALKDPDETMKAAAARIPHARDEEIYRAMLDAALAP